MTALALPMPMPSDDAIQLRPWQLSDLACVELASHDARIPEGTTVPRRYTSEAGRDFIRRQQARPADGTGIPLAIVEHGSDQPVGLVTLVPRPQHGVGGLGYWVVPPARGRGIAAHAVSLLTAWGLAAGGFARIEAWVEPDNRASRGVLARCGYQLEGLLRSFLKLGNRRADVMVWSRLATDAPQLSIRQPAGQR